jgi:hypothetical protein
MRGLRGGSDPSEEYWVWWLTSTTHVNTSVQVSQDKLLELDVVEGERDRFLQANGGAVALPLRCARAIRLS